ncbi:helix-turn-helix domain-containing protein [Mycolicibacterium sp. XJ2546]
MTSSRRPSERLQIRPNTFRRRVRRAEQLLSTSLPDPDVQLLLSLNLRATS